MPLVRIDAMTETISVPNDDLFQILGGHDTGGVRYDPDYLGVHRDDGIVFAAITMRVGRTGAQKKALYRRIVELAAARADVRPENVLISLTENQSIDWSFGNGVAQMVT